MDSVRRMTRRAVAVLALAALGLVLSGPAGTRAATGAAVSGPTPAEQPVPQLFDEASFLLPAGAGVKARWVLPPTSKGDAAATFSVAADGHPVIRYGDSTLLYPDQEYLVAVDIKISAIAQLENGVMLLASGNRLGLLAPPAQRMLNAKGLPLVAFQPLAELPLQRIDLLAASGNTVYCAGTNPQTGHYALFVLHAVKGAGLKDLELLYQADEPITAAVGNDETTWVATGHKVVQVSRRDGVVVPLYTHPQADVTALALTPGGVVASTGKELVLLGRDGALEIMRSAGHRIAVAGNVLYLFFPDCLGVLALDGLGDLSRFNLAVRAVAAGEEAPPLRVTALRFYATSPPDFARHPFAESFDRAQVPRIVAQIDYRGTPAATALRHTVTVSWYEPTGGRLASVSYPLALATPTTSGELLAAIGSEPNPQGYVPPHKTIYRWGDDALGLRYPGRYRVEVLVDGIPAGNGSFELTGPLKPFETFCYDDLARLRALLDQGLSANGRNEHGFPLLHGAIRFGTTRQVELLLERGADPNLLNKDGLPPLAFCGDGYTADWRAKAEALIRHGANVNARVQGQSLVQKYSWHSDYWLLLVDHGADISWESSHIDGQSLLGWVVSSPELCTEKVVSLLLRHGADLNAKANSLSQTALGAAIAKGNADCVALLVDKGPSLSSAQREPGWAEYSALGLALDPFNAASGAQAPDAERSRIVRLLLARGATLNRNETWRMFKGQGPAFFDQATLARTLDEDDSLQQFALQYADKSTVPALRELALRRHLVRARSLAAAAGHKYELENAHEECLRAFALAEERYPAWQVDLVPEPGKPELGAVLRDREAGGVYVLGVTPGGAAARAGLKAGDILMALNVELVKTVQDVNAALTRLTPGVPVRVTFLRDNPMGVPELPLTCGLLEKRLGDDDLAAMNLGRWLAANPAAGQAPQVRTLLGE